MYKLVIIVLCIMHIHTHTHMHTCTQLAARNGFHEAVRLLVDKGGADVQERNATTGWVALHEASFRGHVECVKVSQRWDFNLFIDVRAGIVIYL